MAHHCHWLIFGDRNSPRWFYILSNIKEDIASNYSGLKESPLHQLVLRIVVPEAPSDTTAATFDPTAPNTLNPGTSFSEDTPTHL